METITYHTPVLLHESIDGLNIKPGGIYVDVTYGGGGHSKEILKHLATVSKVHTEGHLYGFDQDADAEKNIVNDEHFTFVRSNFRYIKNFLRYYGINKVDGILADLGVSSHHFDDSERGFSFRFNGKLDMRMNRRAGTTAIDILNGYDENRLANVLFQYGELRNSRKLAANIVARRQTKKIERIEELVAIIGSEDKQILAKVFQALRIEVNHEMDALKEMLTSAVDLLKPDGRLAVITYHSLEDRMVKNIMRYGNINGTQEKDFFGRCESPFELVNKQVIVPSSEELAVNSRARSAKLRIAKRV